MARVLVKTHFKHLTCYLKDTKPSGTSGGTFTSGAWRTRDLNYIAGDTSFISIPVGFDDNQYDNNGAAPDTTKQRFTLDEAGTYRIEVIAPVRGILNGHRCRLYNVTDGAPALLGDSRHSGNADDNNSSLIDEEITITSAKTFEIQHYSFSTVATLGFGIAVSIGSDDEIFTQVIITKIG